LIYDKNGIISYHRKREHHNDISEDNCLSLCEEMKLVCNLTHKQRPSGFEM
jgi:hypothetical protein